MVFVAQVADDLAVVLEDAKEHSSIQLEGHAFAGVPLQVAQYIVFIEQLLTRVHRIADSLELAARCACRYRPALA